MNKIQGSVLFAVLFIFVCISCKTNMYTEAGDIISKMTIDEKIGQMLMVGVPERQISSASESIINDYRPGGIILFGYNLGKTAEETKKFIHDMQQTAYSKYRIPLFISIDQEGGRVKRITKGVTQFPGAMAFGIADDKPATYQAARILGIELRNIGINMNLAPVLDVNNNPLNPVINTRSFGSEAEIVSGLGVSYINGIQKSGCIAVGKHFPGHGDTDKDSHLTLPVINYDIDRLRKIEFLPFINAIDNNVEAIMTAHISFPGILRDNLPATVSKKFLTDILREEMKFKGIIITDDMEMNAVSKIMDFGEAAVKTILAGSDIVLISTHGNSIKLAFEALRKAVDEGRISVQRIDESVRKIIELKLRYDIMNYKEGKINYSEYLLSKENADELKKAGEVNSIISKEAIYYYSNGHSPGFTGNDTAHKVFITSNESFVREIKAKFDTNNFSIYNKGQDFLKQFAKKSSKHGPDMNRKEVSIFYQFDRANAALINELNNRARKIKAKLYLLCTGDPFLLGAVKEIPPTLFSFSNTDESIKQMVSCLNGEFKPKEKINYYLGFVR